MLKKAVTCPSVLAPGAPGVSNGDCWDCLVSPCFIIDLPVHTRTPDVTDPITPLTGSRGGHLQGDTDSVSDPWLPGKHSLQAALPPDYVVSNLRYLLRCFEPACIYAGNCRFRSLSSLRPSRLRFAPAATPLITSGHRETTAAASARAACRASGASRAGLWRPLTGRRSAAAAPGAACFRRRDLSGLSTRVGSGGG